MENIIWYNLGDKYDKSAQKQDVMKNIMKPFTTLIILLSMTFLSVRAEVGYSIELKAQGLEIGNLLEWATDAEVNTLMFVIEKSENGLDFENVGVVNAEGGNEEKVYRFFDTEASGETVFYRLKEIDKDDNFSFSRTVVVKRNTPNYFNVTGMSNTVTDKEFSVTLETVVEKELKYALLDIKGEELFTASIQLDPLEENKIKLDLVNLEEGIYKVIMQLDKEKESLIILKTKCEFDRETNVASKK